MRQRISKERRKIFLDTLAATGSACAAARAATPWSQGEKGGLESFRDLAGRDPQFALDVQEARNAALGRVEQAIADRALTGVQKPVFRGGELVGHETVYDNRLLLRLAQRLSPKAWSDRQKAEVAAKTPGMLELTPRDILRLAPEEQELLIELIEKIGDPNGTENQRFFD